MRHLALRPAIVQSSLNFIFCCNARYQVQVSPSKLQALVSQPNLLAPHIDQATSKTPSFQPPSGLIEGVVSHLWQT